jgi:hydrogenase maturation protease
MTRALVIGLGSFHGDDQAGWLMIDFLVALGADERSVRKAAHPADILSWADPACSLTICDAGYPRGQPGRIGRWSWPTDKLEGSRVCGTHDLPLADVLGLGRQTGWCPEQVEIWTIEGAAFGVMTAVTPAVESGARSVAEQVWQRLHGETHA